MADEVVAEPARGLAEKIDAVNAMTKRLAEKTSGLPKGGLPAVIRSQNTLEAENARLRERLAQTEDIVLQQRRDHERLESTVDGIIAEDRTRRQALSGFHTPDPVGKFLCKELVKLILAGTAPLLRVRRSCLDGSES